MKSFVIGILIALLAVPAQASHCRARRVHRKQVVVQKVVKQVVALVQPVYYAPIYYQPAAQVLGHELPLVLANLVRRLRGQAVETTGAFQHRADHVGS